MALLAVGAMTARPALAVDFKVVTVTVQLQSAQPLGSGRMSSGDGYFDCRIHGGTISGTCSHSYLVVTSAVIDWSVTPDSDSCLLEAPILCPRTTLSFTGEYTADATVYETFKAVAARVYVAKDGAGSGTVTSSPAGIFCGTTCDALFGLGSSVTVTATPAAGSTFVGWDNDGPCGQSGPVCTFGVDGVTVRANFALAATAPPTAPPTAAPTAPPTAGPSHTPGPSVGTSPTAGTSPKPSASPAGGGGGVSVRGSFGASGGTGSGGAANASPASGSPSDGSGASAATGAAGDPAAAATPGPTSDPVAAGPVSSGNGPDQLPLVLAILGGAAIVALGLAYGLRRRTQSGVEVRA